MIATAPHKRDTIRMGARMEAVSPHSCLTRVRGTLVRSSDKHQRPGRDSFLRCRTDGISDAVLQWEAGSGYSCSAESNYTDRGTLIWLSILFQESARSILAVFKASGARANEVLMLGAVDQRFLNLRDGRPADFTSGLRHAVDMGWVELTGQGRQLRLTQSGFDAMLAQEPANQAATRR